MREAVFERAVTTVIIVNVGVVAAGLLIEGHESQFELVHSAILCVFAAELGLRLRRDGRNFFRGHWNCFDAAIIALSFMPMLGVDASVLRLARTCRLLHLARHASTLRVVRLVSVACRRHGSEMEV
jgi:voltage-gated sodium channel